MITAKEAVQIAKSTEENILNSPRFKTMFAELDKRIKEAAKRGHRSIHWADYIDPDLHLAWHGDDVFKNKLYELGYRFSMTDHGSYELSW